MQVLGRYDPVWTDDLEVGFPLGYWDSSKDRPSDQSTDYAESSGDRERSSDSDEDSDSDEWIATESTQH